MLLEDRRRDVLPVVVQGARDLLRGRDHDQRLGGDQIERGEKTAGVHLIAMLRRELRGRGELDSLGLSERALGEDREAPHRLDLVPEQLDADRLLLGRRIDVEDAPAERELSALLDLVGAVVAGVGEQERDVLQVDALALVERESLRSQLGVRDLFRESDRARDDHGGRVGHRVHRRDPEPGQVRRRIQVGFEGGSARRIDAHRARRQEGLQVAGQVAGGAIVRRDHQHGARNLTSIDQRRE